MGGLGRSEHPGQARPERTHGEAQGHHGDQCAFHGSSPCWPTPALAGRTKQVACHGFERRPESRIGTAFADLEQSLQGLTCAGKPDQFALAKQVHRWAASAAATRTRPELATITARASLRSPVWQIVNCALLPPALPSGWNTTRGRPWLETMRMFAGIASNRASAVSGSRS